jgi:aminoglycoside phosphotransferase (APT) family kinase protein
VATSCKIRGKPLIIDNILIKILVATQFPQWKNLPIKPVANSGWDNRTFLLGEHMLIRMPSAAEYTEQVKKEQQWLPRLASLLPLPIPEPLAMGEPAYGYPWHWSIYRWIEGDSAASAQIIDLYDFASSLAQFLNTLQSIDPTERPSPDLQNFYRGGLLVVYDPEVRQALTILKDKIDTYAATKLWEAALATTWSKPPVWVHGDISAGNLLVKDGHLSAVIDFGQLAVGDPACDLVIAWTLFKGKSRKIFRGNLQLDPDTWTRAGAWGLWKALIVAAGLTNPNNAEAKQCWRIIDEVLIDSRR